MNMYLIIISMTLAACELVLVKTIRHADSAEVIIACLIVMYFDAIISAALFAAGISQMFSGRK
jgi:hypothetical protein